MKRLLFSFLFLASFYVDAQSWNEVIKTVANDRASGDSFGYSVSISGDQAIVGAIVEDEDAVGNNTLSGAGSAYIFKDNGSNWVQTAKLVASDRAAGDNFGCSVSISGTKAIVGARYETEDALGSNTLTNSGSAYIFEYNGSNWVQTAKLVASDRAAEDFFGKNVSISNDQAIVSADLEDEDVAGANTLNNAGSAYIFKRDGSGWVQAAKLVASDRAPADRFGGSVSISGNRAIVGAFAEDEDEIGGNTINNAGSAYIFDYNGSIWTQTAKLVSSDRDADDFFGMRVSISVDQAIVAARHEDEDALGNNTLTNSGSAYIFRYNGSSWVQTAKLVASDRASGDMFGSSVSISGNQAIVGNHLESEDVIGGNSLNNAGSAYIFKYDGINWIQINKLVASDRDVDDSFGQSVSISGDKAIVSAYFEDEDASGNNTLSSAGSAYFFKSINVYGQIFNDVNSDCINNNEAGIEGRRAIINPGEIIIETNSIGFWHIDSLPVGTYNITIDTSGHWRPTCGITQSFTVTDPNSLTEAPAFGLVSTQPCSEPDVSISYNRMRPGFSNQTVYVQACNEYIATGALTNAYVDVSLDELITVDAASMAYSDLGDNMYRFDVGTLNPGQCVDFNLSTTLSTDAILGQTLCLQADLFPVESCVLDTIPASDPPDFTPCNLDWDKSSLLVEGECVNDSIVFTITNTGDPGDGDMQCYSPVRLYIDGEYILLDSVMLTGGESITFTYTGDGRTYRLEVDQHPLHPGDSHPNATIELCGDSDNWTADLVNILPMDDADPIRDIYCGVVTGSYDPNDKTGYPLGVGEDHLIEPNQKIEYKIRFQNTGTDTAFTVRLIDTLEGDLDIFSVRSGVGSHNYHFRMHGQRVLEWTFYDIQLPDSNVNEPKSHGFVTFTVNQIKDLADGTEINNFVDIYFDFNDPVRTNTTRHIIGRKINTLVVGVEEHINDQSLTLLDIYPNPNNGKFTIRLNTLNIGQLQLIDFTGKIVQDLNPSLNQQEIQIEDIENGIYFLKANNTAYRVVVTK